MVFQHNPLKGYPSPPVGAVWPCVGLLGLEVGVLECCGLVAGVGALCGLVLCWGLFGLGLGPVPVVGGCFAAVAGSAEDAEVVVDDEVGGGVGVVALVVGNGPAWAVVAVDADPFEA